MLKPSSTPPSASDPSLPDSSDISRRDFGRRALWTAALSIAPTLVACNSHSAPSEAPGQSGTARDLTDAQSQEIEAKLANIVRKYGSRLMQAQRDHLRRILTYNEKMLASIRSFSLQNGDPPASILRISFTPDSATRPSPLSSRNPAESFAHDEAAQSVKDSARETTERAF